MHFNYLQDIVSNSIYIVTIVSPYVDLRSSTSFLIIVFFSLSKSLMHLVMVKLERLISSVIHLHSYLFMTPLQPIMSFVGNGVTKKAQVTWEKG